MEKAFLEGTKLLRRTGFIEITNAANGVIDLNVNLGSILSTGMGLIVSGLAFAAIAVIWQKVRRRLLHNVGEKNHD